MNRRISKLIHKYIVQSTSLTGKELKKIIKTTKKSYNKTPRNKRFELKQQMLEYI